MASSDVPSIDSTMGALFVGAVISMACWGAEMIQLYSYSNKYVNDAWPIKLLVVVVCGLDVAHQSLSLSSVYKYLITHYADPSFLNQSLPEINDIVIINSLICLLVQGFFLSRIYRLCGQKVFLLAILGSLVIGQFAISIVYFCKTYIISTLSERDRLFGFVMANTLVNATTDLGISGTLIYLLQRSRTGFRINEQMIFRLTLFTMQTTLATTVCAVCGALTAILRRHTLIYLAFYRLAGRLYINALLATLNTRSQRKDGAWTDDLGELTDAMGNALRRLRVHSVTEPRMPSTKNQPQFLNIRVDREVVNDEDSMHKIHEDHEHGEGLHVLPVKSKSFEAAHDSRIIL
ncbi:hypothetical protein SCHPADRAFT_524434 [Schizopora paradoxa]|uniref:DUF6534 domain-containing protein n=1 Tax=Schizopora paradoxa TaxID=27342 RepID=A0A0H2RET1_9AGAM|nr:hypothetical protein SCHPADRAFT_524434 [Schizopora paradoxa]